MTALTHDSTSATRGRTISGLALAGVSATTFGLSGALARGLLETGWSAGAVVLIRVTLAALVLAPLGLRALAGRWGLLRRHAVLLLGYGALAVAATQFCYFSAVDHMEVGSALLIEYTAPAAVVLWLWLRHAERPGPLTVLGVALAATGLVLVLDLLSGADLDPVGVLWGLGAMVGVATYFVLSASENDLPPLTLAAGGLVTGAAMLAVLGGLGLLPLSASTAATTYAGEVVPWWLPLVVLGLVTGAVPYATGIAAARRLGSRLASFVGLWEVLAAIGFAWLLLGELPSVVQLLGGVLILTGIVAVQLGERPAPARARPCVPCDG